MTDSYSNPLAALSSSSKIEGCLPFGVPAKYSRRGFWDGVDMENDLVIALRRLSIYMGSGIRFYVLYIGVSS